MDIKTPHPRRNVHLGTTSLAAFDLVEIGDDTSIGQDARLSGYSLEGGMLEIGSIRIGGRCYVGNRSILSPGSILEDGAILEDLSLLPAGARIATGQHGVHVDGIRHTRGCAGRGGRRRRRG